MMRMHATGLQIVLKLIENDFDYLPFSYSYGCNQENSPVLELIFPNLHRIGRNNIRALDGPVTMPKNPGELIDKTVGIFDNFFEIWNTSLISDTMKAPKWLLDLFESLVVGDIVYFKKIENDVSSPWIVGKVISLESGGDGIPRRAEVEYHNLGKFFGQKHITDRAVKSLVKLFNVKDLTWKDDMAEVKRVKTDVDLTESNQTTVENARKV